MFSKSPLIRGQFHCQTLQAFRQCSTITNIWWSKGPQKTQITLLQWSPNSHYEAPEMLFILVLFYIITQFLLINKFIFHIRRAATFKHPVKPDGAVWMEDTLLKNIHVCFPQVNTEIFITSKNLSNNVMFEHSPD